MDMEVLTFNCTACCSRSAANTNYNLYNLYITIIYIYIYKEHVFHFWIKKKRSTKFVFFCGSNDSLNVKPSTVLGPEVSDTHEQRNTWHFTDLMKHDTNKTSDTYRIHLRSTYQSGLGPIWHIWFVLLTNKDSGSHHLCLHFELSLIAVQIQTQNSNKSAKFFS